MLVLLAAMVALAHPIIHEDPMTVDCHGYPGAAGVTYGAEHHVSLAPDVCRDISRVIRHRHASPFMASTSVGTLLHEARHVVQYLECRWQCADFYNVEDDANCEAWKALPAAMLSLHYSRRFAIATAREFKSGPGAPCKG